MITQSDDGGLLKRSESVMAAELRLAQRGSEVDEDEVLGRVNWDELN